MIKILSIEVVKPFLLELTFSNQETAHFDATQYLRENQGSLLEALSSEAFFARCFIDAGALCWPNGLELSAKRVYELSKVLAK